MAKSNAEPRAAWAITWILIVLVYGWPFFFLHGIARYAVGFPWIIIAVLVTIAIGAAGKGSRP